jgi:hypothetical protein
MSNDIKNYINKNGDKNLIENIIKHLEDTLRLPYSCGIEDKSAIGSFTKKIAKLFFCKSRTF